MPILEDIKKYEKQKSEKSEIDFSDFCKQRKTECMALDNNEVLRKNFLINSGGKCPDFWCQKDEQKIFVEIKYFANLTNAAREKRINELKGGQALFFSAVPELKRVLKHDLDDATKKFKNINAEYNCLPRILLTCHDYKILEGRAESIFLGYPFTYPNKKRYVEPGNNFHYHNQEEKGLFHKRKTISAVIYWNHSTCCFNGIANLDADIKFSEKEFNLFFRN